MIQSFRALAFSLVGVAAIALQGWATEPADLERGAAGYIPVVSAETVTVSDAPAENKFSDDGDVLSTPTAGTLDPAKTIRLQELWTELALNEADQATLKVYMDEFVQSMNAATMTTQNVSADSFSESIRDSVDRIMSFVAQRTENPKTVEVVGLAFEAILRVFERRVMGDSSGAVKPPSFAEILRTSNLNEDVILSEGQDASQSHGGEVQGRQLGERELRVQRVVEASLEVFRRGAVSEQVPALHRAMYRSWYLALAKKSRMLRLRQLRVAFAEQKRIEEFKLA